MYVGMGTSFSEKTRYSTGTTKRVNNDDLLSCLAAFQGEDLTNGREASCLPGG
jgi:hypothetical protein